MFRTLIALLAIIAVSGCTYVTEVEPGPEPMPEPAPVVHQPKPQPPVKKSTVIVEEDTTEVIEEKTVID